MTRNIAIFVVLFAITLASVQGAVTSSGAALTDQRMWPLFLVIFGVPAYITWRLSGVLANRSGSMVFPFGKKQKSAAQEARDERLKRRRSEKPPSGGDAPPPAA